MRDIVVKRKAPPVQSEKARSEQALPTKPAKKGALICVLQKGLSLTASLADKTVQLLNPTPPTVIQPAYLPQLPTDRPTDASKQKTAASKKEKYRKSKETLTVLGKNGVATVRVTAKKIHGSVKTPIGKVAVVQGAAIVALFIFVLASRPALPPSVAGSNRTGQPASRQYLPQPGISQSPAPFEEKLAVVQNSTLPLYAWATPWNIQDIQSNSSAYASISAFWATVDSDGINLVTKADWGAWNAFISHNQKSNQTYYLTVSGDPNYTSLVLADQGTQKKHIDELLQTVTNEGFDGIDIDYEGLGNQNRDMFTGFIQNLTKTFHAHKKLVAVTVEARIGNQVPMDWHGLSDASDEVRVMIYDYHAQTTDFPGGIAPIGWVKEVLDYAEQNIDSKKLVIGLGNYGYDWISPDPDTGSWQGAAISYDQAMALAKAKNVPIIRETGIDDRGYDIGSVPAFAYKDDQGRQHAVWFEDKTSLEQKLNLVNQYPVKGVIFWSVGLGDSAFWQDRINSQ